jgi:epoxide hydrolase 4
LTWGHQYIDTNKIRLHCVTQGDGELVILLHGLLEFWYSWRYQIPALSKRFKVVVPDLRGYNDSDKPQAGYDLDTLSQDICGLIQALGYKRAHIVGHDWGGTIAWHFAQHFPEHLGKLAILGAPHPQRLRQAILSNWEQVQRSWYFLALNFPGLPDWLIEQNLRPLLSNMFQQQAVRKSAFTRFDTDLYQVALQKPGVIGSVAKHAQQFLSLRAWWQDWRAMQATIINPTLVMWGEEDSLLCPSLLQNLETLVQAPYELKAVPVCGHWIQQEAPDTVNRELLNFLSQAL